MLVSVLFLLFNCFCISYLKKKKEKEKKERYGIEYDVFVLVVFGVYKRKKGKGKKKKKSFLSNGPKKIPTILLKLQKAVCKYCTFETNPIGNEIYLIDKPQHYFLGVN